MEATNGSFVYHDTLFVDVGQGKRIPRATVTDLNTLLLPKKNAVPIKDETANFYIAQLMHYGLPKTKDKNTAKVRLTTALSAGQLTVPSDVQKIEAGLKKDYASLQRKAKLAARKEQDSTSAKSAAGQKRKAAAMEETKVTITIGDMNIAIDRSSTPAVTKRQKSSPPKKEAFATKVFPNKSNTFKSSATKTTKSSPARKVTPKSKTVANPRQTAQAQNPSSVSTPIQTARRSIPLPQMQSNEEEAPPPYSQYDYQDEDDDHHDQPSKIMQISGEYEIVAHTHDNNATMNLRLSNTRDQLWGKFYLGDREGMIRMDGISNLAGGARHSFGWRSQNAEMGADWKFGKNCDGWMEFDGSGAVQGVFFSFKSRGRFHEVGFRGSLTEDYSCEYDDQREEILEDMEREWHSFPERAYGR